MKIVLSVLKSAAFVFGAYLGFAFLWAIFDYAVNPHLIVEMIEYGYQQSPVHLQAVDTLEFMMNWPVLRCWIIAALLFFSWLGWKKPEKPGLRRIGISIYIAPFVALTLLLVAASLAQEKEPIQ